MEEDGWEGKREVEAVVVMEVVEEMVEEDTTEKEQMGITTKNNWPRAWRKTILAPDDEVTLGCKRPGGFKESR